MTHVEVPEEAVVLAERAWRTGGPEPRPMQTVLQAVAPLIRQQAIEGVREVLLSEALPRAMFEANPDRTLEWGEVDEWIRDSWRQEAADIQPVLDALLAALQKGEDRGTV